MKSVINTNSSTFSHFSRSTFLTFAIALILSACRETFPPYPSEGNQSEPPIRTTSHTQPEGEPPQDPFIFFEVSSGWELDPKNHFKALWPHPSKDHKAPWVLLEFYTLEEAPADSDTPDSNQSGSTQSPQQPGQGAEKTPLQSAKDKILQDYQYRIAKCLASTACASESQKNQPQYTEVQAGETRVYVSESQDIYWNEPSWSSLIAFEKGKKVITFLLQDRAEYYQDLLTTITQTFATNIDAKGAQMIKAELYPTFILDQIPVGNFEGFGQGPTDDLAIIQTFNTSIDLATTFAGSQIYGHTGIDLQYQSAKNDQGDAGSGTIRNIYAMFPGLVILSQQASFNAHWGESMVLATRLSANSEQILTQHYYHLDYQNADGHYQTSRRFNASSWAQSGDIIAQQGASGTWTPHVHVSLRLWQNLQQLQKALENNAFELYGEAYVFDSEEKMAEFIDPKCAWSSAADCSVW